MNVNDPSTWDCHDAAHRFHIANARDYYRTNTGTWALCPVNQPCTNRSTPDPRQISTPQGYKPCTDTNRAVILNRTIADLQAQFATQTQTATNLQNQLNTQAQNATISVQDLTNALRAAMPTPAARPQEVKINHPEPFSGDRTKARRFMMDCDLVLTANPTTYDTRAKQIAYVLSWMRGEPAGKWAEWRMKVYTDDPNQISDLPTFWREFEKAFAPISEANIARQKLASIRQNQMKNKTVDELVSEFRILVARSEITEDAALIEYFKRAIHRKIFSRIMEGDTVPTTIEGWYEKAQRLDNAYREAQSFLRGIDTIPSHSSRTTMTSHNDEERDKCIKEGRCFICQERGHLSRECPRRRTGRSQTNRG